MPKDTQALEYVDSSTQHMRDLDRWATVIERDEEVILAQLIEAGDTKAREKLIYANLFFVVKMARQSAWFVRQSGCVDYLDIIQQGYVGLIDAVDRFDWRHDKRLLTYAVWYIKVRIQEMIAQLAPGLATKPKFEKEKHAVLMAQQTLGDEDAQDEQKIAAMTGLSSVTVRRVLIYLRWKPGSLDEDDSELALRAAYYPSSLPEPEHYVVRRLAMERLRKLVDLFDARTVLVLSLRFGLKDGVYRTHRQVAPLIGVSPALIGLIERNALEKLRTEHGAELRDYLSLDLTQAEGQL